MRVSTLDESTVTLIRQDTGEAVTAAVSQPAANRVLLDPQNNLARGVTYTTTVEGGPKGVKELSGNTLVADKVWSFTVTP